MAKKTPKAPMKRIMAGQAKQLGSLQSIGQVLHQQQEALTAMAATSGGAKGGDLSGPSAKAISDGLNKISSILVNQNSYSRRIAASNNQILVALSGQGQSSRSQDSTNKKILDVTSQNHKAMLDSLSVWKDIRKNTKQLIDAQNQEIGEVLAGEKQNKSMGQKLKDFMGGVKEKVDPDNIKKAILGNFTGVSKKARDAVHDIDYAKQMKALGDIRNPAQLKAAAADSRAKKQDLAKADDAYRKIKATGASDQQIAQSRPDIIQARSDALTAFNKTKIAMTGLHTDRPDTPKGNFTGDQPSVPLNHNTPKGNFTGDEPSAPLVQLPSDKGQLAQSTTDMLADQQHREEADKEKMKLMSVHTSLLEQIAANTGAMAGKKSSAAGGPEDQGQSGGVLDTLGSGLGMLGKGAGGGIAGIGKGLGSAMSSLGQGASALGKGIGNGLVGLLQGLATGMAALANPATLIGLGAFTLAAMGIGKALEYAAPAIQAFAPILQSLIDTMGNVFVTAIEKLPDVLKAVGDVIQKIGDGIVGTVKAIADGIVSIIDAVSRLFGRTGSDNKNAASQGQQIGNNLVAAIKNGGSGGGSGSRGPSDSQNDELEQRAGVKFAPDGTMTIVDQKKYDTFTGKSGGTQQLQSRADQLKANGGSGSAPVAAAPNTGQAMADDQAQKMQQQAAAASRAAGPTVVNAPQQTTNNTTVGSTMSSARNQESSIGSWVRRQIYGAS